MWPKHRSQFITKPKNACFHTKLADLSYSNLYYVHNIMYIIFWKEKLDLIVILGAVCEVEPNYFTFPPHLHRPALYFILGSLHIMSDIYVLLCYLYIY